MKEGWEIKRLGEVATYVNGYAFKPEQWGDEGTPIIRIQNLNNPNAPFNYCNIDVPTKYLVQNGDILISWSASLGVYEWNNGDAYLNQHIFKVVFDKLDIDKYYLKFAVSAKLNDMQKQLHGATMKHIVKKDFDNTQIPVPPIAEQEKIVAELDCLSGIIEKKKQQLKEYDALAQSIFYEMFGDPVENDKGWEIKSLGDEFEISSGGTPDTKNALFWDAGDISWIGSNMCHNEIIYHNDGKYITKAGLDHSSAKMYQNGFVIIALVGATIGKTALLRFETTTNQNVAGINVPSNGNYTSEYIFYLIQNLYGLFQSIGSGKFKMANLRFVRSLPLLVPPLALQQEFASKIEAIEKQKALIKKSIVEVETLFNSRMEYYFN